MIDPTKYMPVLQCYKCYNVTTRASEREKEGSRIIIQGTREGDGAVFCSIVGMGPRFEGLMWGWVLVLRGHLSIHAVILSEAKDLKSASRCIQILRFALNDN